MRLLRWFVMASLTFLKSGAPPPLGLALLVIVGVLFSARAEAVTVRDLIELSRAGLSDDVLIELIAVDGSVFNLDAATLRELKAGGVSEKVILAMLRAGRTPVPLPAAAPEMPEAPTIQVDVPPPTIVIQQAPPVVVNVPVPYYVPVVVPDGHRRRRIDRIPDRHPHFVDATPSTVPGRQFINTFGAGVPMGHVEAILHRPKTTCWGNVCW
jgi:hypothetical protein